MTPAELADAAARLRAGGLVAFPTETVYGLGADATRDAAVAAVFAVKGRPTFNPLIVHAADAASLAEHAVFSPIAATLARSFWPGPLTLVLPRRPESGVSLLASAGLDTLAVRVPDHPVARALLAAVGRPVVAPSANRSGHVSATTAAHVSADFAGEDVLVLDGGPCVVGLESTVLDVTRPRPAVLRAGGLPLDVLERALGGPLVDATAPADDGEVRSPGQLLRHYAPARPVRLDATTARPGEALLAFGPADRTGYADVFVLSERGDPVEAAARLFAGLRALDRAPHVGIAVSPIPQRGLGLAINDRLRRAAAGRAATSAGD